MDLFQRYEVNPILRASDFPHTVSAVSNPGVALFDHDTLLLVPVEDRTGVSHLSVGAARAVERSTGGHPIRRDQHPLVAFESELERLVELTARVVADEGGLDYRVGTMIELPRAALRAGDLAAHAEFFSFGTNDLTQTTPGSLERRAGPLPHLLPGISGA